MHHPKFLVRKVTAPNVSVVFVGSNKALKWLRGILGAFRLGQFSSGTLCQSIHPRGVGEVGKIGVRGS